MSTWDRFRVFCYVFRLVSRPFVRSFIGFGLRFIRVWTFRWPSPGGISFILAIIIVLLARFGRVMGLRCWVRVFSASMKRILSRALCRIWRLVWCWLVWHGGLMWRRPVFRWRMFFPSLHSFHNLQRTLLRWLTQDLMNCQCRRRLWFFIFKVLAIKQNFVVHRLLM